MSPIVIQCPSCGQSYKIPPEQILKYAGRTIPCKKCRQPFSFDAALDAAAQAAGRDEADEDTDPPPAAKGRR